MAYIRQSRPDSGIYKAATARFWPLAIFGRSRAALTLAVAGVWGVGFRVYGLWFRVYGLGVGIRVEGLGFRVEGLELRVKS